MEAVAHPLGMSRFALLLDCLKHYRLSFPSRTKVIAGILNAAFPSAKKVTNVQVYNVIDKVKKLDLSSGPDKCLGRPPMEPIASLQGALHVAFPHPVQCILCSTSRKWAVETRQPFFFPHDMAPGKGVVHEKFCGACNTMYSVGYYCPNGSSVKRPYPAFSDHNDWVEFSGETLISRELLRRHDRSL
jgi:hypothetical protein